MNKTEFVKALAEKTGVSQKEAAASLEATLEVIGNALKNGEKINFIGFGTFETKVRAARMGRNPATGKTVEYPEKQVVAFHASKTLLD